MVLESDNESEHTSQNIKSVEPTSQNMESDPLEILITSEEFSLKGRIDIPPKFWYLLIAVLCATLGVSYEEIMKVVL